MADINPATGKAFITVPNAVVSGVTPGTFGTSGNISANQSRITPYTPVAPVAPMQPSTAPASSTVVSNANVLENKIPALNASANALTTATPTVLDSGTPPALPNTDYGSLYKQAAAGLPDQTQDPIYQQEMQLINSIQSNNDATTGAYVNSIQSHYGDLYNQMKQNQASTDAQTQNALLLGGSSRYAPVSSGGILDLKTKANMQDLANLANEENQKVAEVKQAQATQNYQLMEKKLSELDAVRTNKQAQAKAIADNMLTQNKATRDTAIQSQKDNAIASLVTAGTTNTGSIVSALAKQGITATAADVAKSLQTIATSAGSGSIDKLTGDVKNFYLLKGIQGALPADILALPPDKQLAAYISRIHAATKGNTSTSSSSGSSTSGNLGVNFGASNGIPSAVSGTPSDPVGNESYLSTLPGDLPDLVRGLADYSINPSTIPVKQYKGAAGYTQADLTAMAKKYDPTYDAKQYATRQAMQKNITSGAYSKTVVAANTLIGHLKELSDAASNLGGNVKGRPIGILNSAANLLSGASGSDSVNNFNIAADAVASEAATIYKGGSPAEGEIKDWRAKLNPDMTDKQIKGAINTIVNLMGGKLGNISTEYKKVMGKPAGFEILPQSSVAILKSMGIDPAKVDPTYNQNSDIGGSSPDELLNYANTGGSSTGAYDPSVWNNAK